VNEVQSKTTDFSIESNVLQSMETPVFLVNDRFDFVFCNPSCEIFFERSLRQLTASNLVEILTEDSALVSLVQNALSHGTSLSEHDLIVESRKFSSRKNVSAYVSLYGNENNQCVVNLFERKIGREIDDKISNRFAAKSITHLGASLAHEIKNPLSGIKGAAQLMEADASEDEQELLSLIQNESDRIVQLVDEFDFLSDTHLLHRENVNLHEVLEHVKKLAQVGFGKSIVFSENYDPSLPDTFGDRNMLVQALLNLMKNACEAAPADMGHVYLSTSFQHSIKRSLPGGTKRVELPLVIGIKDNGSGISEKLISNLFEPFATSKPDGKGLGLSIVAKIIDDLGGLIEFSSSSEGTEFRLLLPQASEKH